MVNMFVIVSFVGSIFGLYYSLLFIWVVKGNVGEVVIFVDGEIWILVVIVGGLFVGLVFWYFSLVGLWFSGGVVGVFGI